MKTLALLVASIVAAAQLVAAPPVLKPADEGPRDPSLVTFRQQLKDAVARRDAAFIREILDPQVVSSYGGEGGAKEVLAYYKLEEREGEFWREFEEIMALGGGKFEKDGSFFMPYVFGFWPEKYDGFEYGAVTGANVAVRTKPSRTAPVAATFSYAILGVIPGDGEGQTPWVQVKLPQGGHGYISRDYFRQPPDYRAGFAKKKGKWKLITFIAGD